MANPAARMMMIDEEISMVRPQKYMRPSRSISVKAMHVKTQKTVTRSEMRIRVTQTTAAIVRPKLRINSLLITCKQMVRVLFPHYSLQPIDMLH